MKLTEALKHHADQSANRINKDKLEIMKGDIQHIINSMIINHAPKKGDLLPNFELNNAVDKIISSKDLLSKGKVIISFYRGGWCPYCNLELQALQEILPQIKEKGATLVAITPETPDNSLSTIEKNNLDFQVLTDFDNAYARSMNLVYELSPELVSVYKDFSIDVLKSNGVLTHELPIAATYVVDTDGIIVYDFLAEDYKLRANPDDIIKAL